MLNPENVTNNYNGFKKSCKILGNYRNNYNGFKKSCIILEIKETIIMAFKHHVNSG